MSKEITEQQIDDFIVNMMKTDPVKFVRYCLIVIGRDIEASGAEEFIFKQDMDSSTPGKRINVEVTGKITTI